VSKKWFEVATTRDIDDDEVLQVEANNHCVALYKLEGKFYATCDLCACKNGNLSDGFIDEDEIDCPVCATSFVIKTGVCSNTKKTIAIKRYPVKTDNGLVYVGVDTESNE
jgi:naphthalene 1,2-dioxygenase ferredoxin component